MEKIKMAKKEKVKKQKKEKKTDFKTENIIRTHKDQIPDVSENNHMKKKKRKVATYCVNGDVNDDPDTGVGKKKKKKLVKDEEQTESVQSLVKEETMMHKKKTKNKSLQTDSCKKIVKIEKTENLHKEKTSNKTKMNKILVADTKIEEKDKKKKIKWTEENISIDETVTTKRSKDKSKLPVNRVNINLYESNQIQNIPMKKKKDKFITEENKIIHEVKKEKKAASKCKKEKAEEKDIHNKKKTNKKSKSESAMDNVVESKNIKKEQDFVDLPNYSKPTKKKKKCILEESDQNPLLLKCEIEAVATNKGKKNKRSKEMEININAGVRSKKKRKKIKEEHVDQEESSQVEVVFLSEKAGNTDEVNINQERRQALQMEIDQASQPQKPAKPSGMGQWSTAEFESSEQQQKFVRLMGGFKKGSQPASSSSGSGSMALGKGGQQQLQQGLLGEFERAQSRRMDFSNRGAGLGFTAPSKKFFDVNATRSIRFDD